MLCVPITVSSPDSALADATQARDAGADLVEFRIDELFDAASDEDTVTAILKLVSDAPLPCIVTCRTSKEGGAFSGDEETRVDLYRSIATGNAGHAARYIDIELASYEANRRFAAEVEPLVSDGSGSGPSLLLSVHDFNGRPADITRRLLSLRSHAAARVLKLAYRARSLRDNLELFEFIRESDRPMIALGMGEFGLMSRVLAPKFGGFLTFASLRPASATAPGQPTVTDLLELYRFRSIRRSTRVYGVIGWPVSHSMSPLIHNAAFDALGHDGVYLPLPVAAGDGGSGGYESFKATLLQVIDDVSLDFSGASVTIPHKENLVRLAHEQGWLIEDAAIEIGAANTLAVRRSAAGHAETVRVFNTDAPAIRSCIESEIDPAGGGVSVAVVGAGGVGRAAAFAMARAGASVVIYNRDLNKATLLAEACARATGSAVRAEPWGSLAGCATDVFIQCTPVGMKAGPGPSESPIPVEAISKLRNGREMPVVLDTVYNPVQTPLLRDAARSGWKTIDGVRMFVNQAAGQFRVWTGAEPPVGLFDRLVRSALA